MIMRSVIKELKRRLRRLFFFFLKWSPSFVRFQFMRSLLRLPSQAPPELEVKLAQTKEEFEQAFILVQDSYSAIGLTAKSSSGLRATKFHLFPTTAVIIAKWNDEVVGTVSHILDSSIGLPVEDLWPLESFRKKGERIAEISSFAIKKGFRGHQSLLFFLTRFTLDYAMKHLHVDRWAIATHPRTKDFYQGILCFKEIDKSIKSYSSVRGAKAFGQTLNLRQLRSTFYKVYGHKKQSQNIYRFYFETQFENCFQFPHLDLYRAFSHVWTSEELHYFMRDKSDLHEKMTSREKNVLYGMYYFDQANWTYKKNKRDCLNRSLHQGMRVSVSCPTQIQLNDTFDRWEGSVINVSRQGVGIVTSLDMTVGDVTSLRFQIGPDKPIFLKAQVRWCSQQHRYGLRILKSDEVLWFKYIESLETLLIKDQRERRAS